jgi:hypothetical protein
MNFPSMDDIADGTGTNIRMGCLSQLMMVSIETERLGMSDENPIHSLSQLCTSESYEKARAA